MAKKKVVRKKPTNGFKKGNRHGAKGGAKKKGVPTYDAEVLATRTIDNRMVVRYITINSHLTEAQARKRMADPDISIFEKRVLGSILGDDEAIPFTEIINRLAGKNAERHVHEVKDKYKDMTNEELIAEKERLAEANRKSINYIEEQNGMRPHQMKEAQAALESTKEEVTNGNIIDAETVERTPTDNT